MINAEDFLKRQSQLIKAEHKPVVIKTKINIWYVDGIGIYLDHRGKKIIIKHEKPWWRRLWQTIVGM